MKFCTKCGTQLRDNDSCPKCNSKLSTQYFSLPPENSLPQKNKSTKIQKAYLYPIITGVILILVGIFIQVPGGILTTYESLDGDKTNSYAFDNRYSSIDEYVGGDAYNYIIGATLVAGKISGIITAKAVFLVGGIFCLCLGITLRVFQKKEQLNTYGRL